MAMKVRWSSRLDQDRIYIMVVPARDSTSSAPPPVSGVHYWISRWELIENKRDPRFIKHIKNKMTKELKRIVETIPVHMRR